MCKYLPNYLFRGPVSNTSRYFMHVYDIQRDECDAAARATHDASDCVHNLRRLLFLEHLQHDMMETCELTG